MFLYTLEALPPIEGLKLSLNVYLCQVESNFW
jgi:hypothetical protein